MSICAECKHLDLNDRNSSGKYYCAELSMYVWGDDDGCSKFWEDRYRSTSDINSCSSGGDGCLFTVATMFALKDKFRDDGYPLATLRSAREVCKTKDRYLKEIEKYYKISPHIVSKINSRKDKKEIYLKLFRTLVEPCVELVKNQQYEAACACFCAARDSLIAEYCPELA